MKLGTVYDEESIMAAWAVISNVDWRTQSDRWQAAAARWAIDHGFHIQQERPKFHPTAVAVTLASEIRDHLRVCLRTTRGVDCPDLLHIVDAWARRIAAATDDSAKPLESLKLPPRRIPAVFPPRHDGEFRVVRTEEKDGKAVEWVFIATVCYGMHNPWWCEQPSNEPLDMKDGDVWEPWPQGREMRKA